MRRGARALFATLAAGVAASALAGGLEEAPSVRAPVDPAARLPSGDEAAEHWDLAAHFDSGHRVYARVLITNEGPGERTAVAFGHVLTPDGDTVEFQNGRRQGRWTLSPDRLRIDIGSSELRFESGRRVLEVDNDKRETHLRIEIPDDAGSASAPPGPAGYRLELLNLASPATGRVRLPGMDAALPLSGRATLSHSWFRGPERSHLRRRIDVSTLAPGARAFLCQLIPPEGPAWHWLVAGDAQGVREVSPVTLEAGSPTEGEHSFPRRIEVRETGLNHHEEMGLVLSLGEPRLRVDPLDALPALLRMVYSFGDDPQQLWVDARANGTLKSRSGDAVLRIEGAGVAALFFADSFPPTDPSN